MKSHVTGNSQVAASAPTLHLGTYRRAIMAVLSADVFTAAEKLRANHNVHECEDATKLALWLKNVRRVLTEREAEAQGQALVNLAQGIERFEAKLSTEPVRYATATQTSEVHKLALHRAITLGERTKALLALPRLTKPEATLLIGELWAKILHRTGDGAAGPDSPASYSSAA
jgi:hypothetical protein